MNDHEALVFEKTRDERDRYKAALETIRDEMSSLTSMELDELIRAALHGSEIKKPD